MRIILQCSEKNAVNVIISETEIALELLNSKHYASEFLSDLNVFFFFTGIAIPLDYPTL
jgi:hypothetical protein